MEQITICIKTSDIVLLEFLKKPFNLSIWTVHRDLYAIENTCSECIYKDGKAHFAEIKTTLESINLKNHIITFSWFQKNTVIKSFGFKITNISESEVQLSMEPLKIKDDEKRKTLTKLINIEFGLLKQHLENTGISINKADAIFLQTYHQNLSF